MSSHFKFEIHARTPGETDDEEALVELLADRIRVFAESWRAWQEVDVEITVREVERT